MPLPVARMAAGSFTSEVNMSRNEKRIRDKCTELGIEVESLRWEPIGMAMEMCGHSGGWILNDFDPVGLSTEEALANLPAHARYLKIAEENALS